MEDRVGPLALGLWFVFPINDLTVAFENFFWPETTEDNELGSQVQRYG